MERRGRSRAATWPARRRGIPPSPPPENLDFILVFEVFSRTPLQEPSAKLYAKRVSAFCQSFIENRICFCYYLYGRTQIPERMSSER